jgi:hypothetical protein
MNTYIEYLIVLKEKYSPKVLLGLLKSARSAHKSKQRLLYKPFFVEYCLHYNQTVKKMPMKLLPSVLRQIGLEVLGMKDRKVSYSRCDRIFRSCFGCSIRVSAVCWNRMVDSGTIPTKGCPKHLFWALSLLRSYGTESYYCALYGVDAYTFRKWSWAFINAIARLKTVSIFKYHYESTKFIYLLGYFFFYINHSRFTGRTG